MNHASMTSVAERMTPTQCGKTPLRLMVSQRLSEIISVMSSMLKQQEMTLITFTQCKKVSSVMLSSPMNNS